VKQGCPLSPLLFGIYIDDLESAFASSAADLDLPTLGGRPVPPLLYADDLALASRSQAGLQTQMHLLMRYSELWRIFVNVAKTRCMVFQHPGSAAVSLRLMYDGSQVEAVDAFCYLGVVYRRTAPFSDAGLVRAATGRSAEMAMTRRCRELGIHDPALRLRLFDALVRPVMLYGIEMWGPHSLGQVDAPFEREHRSFLRRIIGVRHGTPSAVVLAELGRYPLTVLATLQVCKYWNRLLAMDDGRLVRLAFLEGWLHVCPDEASWRSWSQFAWLHCRLAVLFVLRGLLRLLPCLQSRPFQLPGLGTSTSRLRCLHCSGAT
jgi:hypothetical protein